MKRGPYNDKKDLFELARKIRKEDGLGYREIAKIVGINHHTIKKWVGDIPAPDAYKLAQERKKLPFSKLKAKDAIRARLIEMRSHQCESCKLTEWLGKPITLEVEHVDGDNKNNSEDNLKLLCPNCHSQTPTWRRKKKASEKLNDNK